MSTDLQNTLELFAKMGVEYYQEATRDFIMILFTNAEYGDSYYLAYSKDGKFMTQGVP